MITRSSLVLFLAVLAFIPATMSWSLEGADGLMAIPSSSGPVFTQWRAPHRDAANCLYFLIRFHDRSISYSRVLNALQGGNRRTNLGSVRSAARQLGLNCGIYRSGFDDILKLNKPALVYMEDGGVRGGSFCVLLSIYESGRGGGGALVLNGGLATLRHISLEDFRRQWTGYILIADGQISDGWSWFPPATVLSVATLGGSSLVLIYLRRRLRTGSPTTRSREARD